MISRQKGLSTTPIHHSLSCLHACIQILPPPKRPFPPPLPHLIPCLVHLVVLVILKNSFPSFLESLPHLLLLPPGRVSCSLFSTPIMPSFYIYIALITSLYNSSPPHKLEVYSWGSYLEWVNEWDSLSQFDFPFMIYIYKMNYWNVTGISKSLWNTNCCDSTLTRTNQKWTVSFSSFLILCD